MDGVFDFLADSLVPSSPVTPQRPNFLGKTPVIGDTTTTDSNKAVPPRYLPLTPLESKLKDIIVNIYGDSPTSSLLPVNEESVVVQDLSFESADENSSTPATDSLSKPCLTIPKHLMSSLKNLAVETVPEQTMSSDLLDPPIFSADDAPLSGDSIRGIGFNPSFSVRAPSKTPQSNETPPNGSMFSADDLPPASNLPPESVPSTSSLSAAFSMPFNNPNRKLPGHPQRVESPSPIPQRSSSSVPRATESCDKEEDSIDGNQMPLRFDSPSEHSLLWPDSKPEIPNHIKAAKLSQETDSGSLSFQPIIESKQDSLGTGPALVDPPVPIRNKPVKPVSESSSLLAEYPLSLPSRGREGMKGHGSSSFDPAVESNEQREHSKTSHPALFDPPTPINKEPVKKARDTLAESPLRFSEVPLVTNQRSKAAKHNPDLSTGDSPPISSPLSLPLVLSGNNSSDLEKQVQQLMKQKANLEGRLQSVVEEYQGTLRDKSQLSSRLSKAETELKAAHKELSSKEAAKPGISHLSEDEGSDLVLEMNRLESALRKKRQEMAVMAKERNNLRKQVEEMSSELVCSNENIEKKNAEVRKLGSDNVQLREQLEENSESIQTLNSHIANLQASLESTESAKTWLHDQLQESIQSKLKLQEELRGFRITSISQTVKLDQLEQENMLLNQQLHDMQNRMLKDKANLVNELEAIEADVVSKESLYSDIESSKQQLEQLLKLRNEQLQKLGDEVVQQRAKIEDLEHATSEDSGSVKLLTAHVKKLEEEKQNASVILEHEKEVNAAKERELQDVKKAKNSLQQRLQQAETALISKEGTIQGLKDSGEMIRQELQGVAIAKECVENELTTAQKSLAEAESALQAAEPKFKHISDELLALKLKLRNSEAAVNSMKSQLSKKEEELQEKNSELATLKDQSSGIVDQFHSLQSQVHSVADKSGVEMEEKNNTISRLVEERDQMGKDLEERKLECERLKHAVNEVEGKNARLQGELESLIATSPKMDDIKRILQEKNALEGQLGAEKISHQQESIKYQAKIARLQTDLNDVKKESKQQVSGLQENVNALQREIDLMKSESDQISKKASEDVLHEVTPLRTLLDSKERELQGALERQNILENEKEDLKREMEKELARINEIQRVDALMASQIKQSAAEREQKLNEEIQGLVIDIEHLKGRLAGTDTAQQCLREHANALENSLAEKEAYISQVMSQNASLLGEKELEVEDLRCKHESLQDLLGSMKAELEKVLTEGLFDRQRADDLEKAVADKEAELNRVKEAREPGEENNAIRERLRELEDQKEVLQAEIRTMKQQLILFDTSHECTKKELQEKVLSVDILEKKLQLAQDQLLQSQEELGVLKNHIHSSRIKEAGAERGVLPQSFPPFGNTDQTISDDGMSVSSTDEALGYLSDQNSLYRAQLQELQGRLVKARNEGQEVAESKTSGEIKSLQSQLGAKSKTLRTLQDCVSSLKDEMNTLQLQVGAHSSSLANSYRSSREIESKIEGLRRSQSGSCSPRVATPTIH